MTCLFAFSCKSETTNGKELEQASLPPVEEIKTIDGEKWKPAEFKGKRGKWRDPSVYIDGELAGYLWYGDLPKGFEPIWIEERESLDFKPGDKGPKFKINKVRRFLFSDYFESLGIDLKKVTSLQIQGSGSHVAAIEGDQFRKHKKGLAWTYGRQVTGKAKVLFPEGMETNTVFDLIQSVSLYIDKTPPTISENDKAVLDGQEILDIPYYGPAARGGIRFYVDNYLVALLKRNQSEELGAKLGTPTAEEGFLWPLGAFLEHHGVLAKNIQSGQLVYADKLVETKTSDELLKADFETTPRAKGHLLFGKDKKKVEVVKFFTKGVKR